MNERTPSSLAPRSRWDAGFALSHCRSANRWPRSTYRSPSRCALDVRGVLVSVLPSSGTLSGVAVTTELTEGYLLISRPLPSSQGIYGCVAGFAISDRLCHQPTGSAYGRSSTPQITLYA